MRLPTWLFLLGVVTMIGLTALCSVVTFTAAQRVTVDMANSGIMPPANPLEALSMLSNTNALETQGEPVGLPTFAVQAATPTMTPEPSPTLAPGITPTATEIPPEPTLDPLAGYEWTDPRRFNLLLLGIDQRNADVETEEYFRTDTIMILSIHPARKTVGVLSIPRDLWVSIPGFREGRINTANALGDSNALPNGGPGLAAATIEANIGLKIDAYLRINFDVFNKVVDTIAPDGIEMCLQEEIDDPHYPDGGYGFLPIYFPAGCQMMNSTQLLQYARTRVTDGGDFDRSRRQQEVMRALQKEILNAGGIVNFIGKIPALWEELSGSYVTNLTLQEIINLGALAQDIKSENIRFATIDNMHVQFAQTSTGDQVLVPNYAAIRQLISETFDPPQDLTLADLRSRAESEGASIVVYNNTNTMGLASQTQEWLLSRGLSIQSVGNIPEPTNMDTTIRIYGNKQWTARYLAALLGLPAERVIRSNDGLTSADVMVAIGPDIQSLLSAD